MSEVKVNKISPRTNCGTVTLGDSGDTFTIPAGVTLTNSGTATGFGPTGAVSWNTTAVTSSPLTAVSGVGYFINTSGGAITVNLPVGVPGAIISLADYTNTWQTNAVTVNANGSEKIGGIASPANLNTEGQSVTLLYVDSTEGWKNVQDSTSNVTGNVFVQATGGTITTCGDFKIHTFTGPGTFTVSCAGTPAGSTSVEYLVVAGGGGGANASPTGSGNGGGGAGGFRQNYPSPAFAGLPVTATAYPITVGAGGAGLGAVPCYTNGNNGNNSVFSTITSTGGGGGGGGTVTANSGGSGGGGGYGGGPGAGNTPPTSPSQGNPGGNSVPPSSSPYAASGGGGAGASGSRFPSSSVGGAGGNGTATSISGSSVTYAGGGGGGGGRNSTPGTGGAGGSGGGGAGSPGTGNAVSGTPNTGGGGGGSGGCNSGAGGSGIVVIRYKYQ